MSTISGLVLFVVLWFGGVNRQMDLNGVVRDSNGQPIADVQVFATVIQETAAVPIYYLSKPRSFTVKTVSGPDGRFFVSAKGEQISLKFKKSGYRLPPSRGAMNNYSFRSASSSEETSGRKTIVVILEKTSEP